MGFYSTNIFEVVELVMVENEMSMEKIDHQLLMNSQNRNMHIFLSISILSFGVSLKWEKNSN